MSSQSSQVTKIKFLFSSKETNASLLKKLPSGKHGVSRSKEEVILVMLVNKKINNKHKEVKQRPRLRQLKKQVVTKSSKFQQIQKKKKMKKQEIKEIVIIIMKRPVNLRS